MHQNVYGIIIISSHSNGIELPRPKDFSLLHFSLNPQHSGSLFVYNIPSVGVFECFCLCVRTEEGVG